MTDDPGVHVVFGATGGAGGALLQELSRRGVPARAVSRSGGGFPAPVETARGDALEPEAVRRACEGAGTVYHCVNVPYGEWAEKLPRILENLIGGAEAAGARLVYLDNLYMYDPAPGPMTEDAPVRPRSRKGALRARLADTLLEAHARGRVRAAIVRASDFYGPGRLNAVAGDRVFQPALAGKKAMWVGRLDVPHTLSYIEDVARALATLGDSEEALGEVWHAPAAEPLTARQFLTRVFEQAGHPPRIGAYSRTAMRVVGLFSRQLREVVEMMYQFEAPFVMDSSRFTRTFGLEATPHDEAIRHTLAWYRGTGAA